MRIKPLLLLAAMGAALTSAAHASPIVLPDACGNPEVKFDIDFTKNPPPPAAPAAGKAQIVFIEVGPGATIRFGMDGKWLGATKGDSWFAVDVDPGEHHFCGAWQSSFKTLQKNLGMTKFTAEAGKTYYVEFKISATHTGGGFTTVHNSATGGVSTVSNPGTSTLSTDMGTVDEDEGRFRIKSGKLAAAKPDKEAKEDK
jgi:hypothetical protein